LLILGRGVMNVIDDRRVAVEEFLLGPCRAKRAEVAGEVRRRTEIIEELAFVIETDDFPAVVAPLERYGGRTPLVSSVETAIPPRLI